MIQTSNQNGMEAEMLEALYALRETVERNLLTANVEEFVALIERRIDLDEMIVAEGGVSFIILN